MADIFRPGQAQRLFASIMAGGSLGAICGPLLTANLVGGIGSGGIILLAIICLSGNSIRHYPWPFRTPSKPETAYKNYWWQCLGRRGACLQVQIPVVDLPVDADPQPDIDFFV